MWSPMATTAEPEVRDDVDDLLWKALADPCRRRVLDLLRDGPATVCGLAAEFSEVTRFAVMKHLAVLEAAGLVIGDRAGRERWCRLNPAPLRSICLRWLRPFEVVAADRALRIKELAERKSVPPKPGRRKERTI